MERFAALSASDVIYSPPSNDASDILLINSGRLMFQTVSLANLEKCRDYDVEFGILPYPKYDESQKDYISLDWGGLMSVPSSVTDPELVGAAMELFAWESENEVIPAYYDLVLAGKLSRDKDSSSMLDIVFDSIAYEIGGNYFGFSNGFNDLFYALPRLAVSDKSSDFSSLYEKHSKSAEKEIEKFYKALNELENG